MNNPATKHIYLATSDLDRAEQIYLQSIANAKILRVADKKKFRLELDCLNFNNVTLVSNSMTSRCRMGASLGDDDFRLVLALQAPSYFHWRGETHPVSKKQGLIVRPDTEIEVDRFSGSKTLVINTSYSILKEHLQLLINDNVDGPLKFTSHIDLTRGPGVYLQELMSRLSYDARYNNTLLHEPGIKRGYGELILGAILALPHNYSDRLQSAEGSVYAPSIVRKAEDYIRSHYSERITISDLTSVCQCTRKVLFSSFKSSRGYSPMSFLQEQRLQAARRILVDSDINTNAISDVAHQSGFAHLGRFSEHYRKRFGELPSVTLKKS